MNNLENLEETVVPISKNQDDILEETLACNDHNTDYVSVNNCESCDETSRDSKQFKNLRKLHMIRIIRKLQEIKSAKNKGEQKNNLKSDWYYFLILFKRIIRMSSQILTPRIQYWAKYFCRNTFVSATFIDILLVCFILYYNDFVLFTL